jgi:glutaredoxin
MSDGMPKQYFTIYSMVGCGWCTEAKKLLDEKGAKYVEIVIGQDVTREEFKERYPDVKGVPLILMTTTLGGYNELKSTVN